MRKVTAPAAHGQSKCTHLRKVIALIWACTKLLHTHLHMCKVTAPIQCMSILSAPICAKYSHSSVQCACLKLLHHLHMGKVIAPIQRMNKVSAPICAKYSHSSVHAQSYCTPICTCLQSNCTNSAHEQSKGTHLRKVMTLICTCTKLLHPSAHAQSNCTNSVHEQSKRSLLRTHLHMHKIILPICPCTI